MCGHEPDVRSPQNGRGCSLLTPVEIGWAAGTVTARTGARIPAGATVSITILGTGSKSPLTSNECEG